MSVAVEISEPGSAPRTERPASLPADFGRGPGCAIRIESRSVSARHCSLLRVAGQFFVVDRHSTNGTMLNGERLVPGRLARLVEGDVVQLGQTTFKCTDDRRPFSGGTRTIFRQMLGAADVGEADAKGPALVVLNGPAAGSAFPLPAGDGGTTSMGREGDGSFAIPDRLASSRHCTVTRRDGTFLLSDCGSRNGTFVNGRRICAGHRLAAGDEITAGDTVLLAVGIGEAADSAVRPARPDAKPSVERFVLPAAALVGIVSLGLAAALVGYALF